MRSKSANEFTINDLKEIAELCKSHGVKSYLTVNTVIYDEDISLMREIIDAAAESGISAVIASDAAVMMYCRERGMEVHLSTQLNISNKEALKFYAQFADVVVLARELNLRQVKKIYEAIQSEQIRGPNGDLVRIVWRSAASATSVSIPAAEALTEAPVCRPADALTSLKIRSGMSNWKSIMNTSCLRRI